MLQMWTDFARFGDPNGDPQRVSQKSRFGEMFQNQRDLLKKVAFISTAKRCSYIAIAYKDFHPIPIRL